MRRLPAVLFTGLFALAVLAGDNEVVSVSPAGPRVGQTVTVTYHPDAPGALLRGAGQMDLHVFTQHAGGPRTLAEIPMAREGGAWKGSFLLDDPTARLVAFRFASGDRFDGDRENGACVLVHGPDGRPLKGAHLARGDLRRVGRLMAADFPPDIEGARADYRREQELYPDSAEAQPRLWGLDLGKDATQETKDRIRQELDRFTEARRSDELALSWAIISYRRLGDASRAEEIQKAEILARPKGLIARSQRANEARKQTDPLGRVEAEERLLADFPPADAAERRQRLQDLLYWYDMAGALEKEARALEELSGNHASIYTMAACVSLSERYTEKGQPDKGLRWSDRAIALLTAAGPSASLLSVTAREFELIRRDNLAGAHHARAIALEALGRGDEAEAQFEQAHELAQPGQDDEPAHLKRLVANGKIDRALDLGVASCKAGVATDEVRSVMKQAYVKKHGSEEGFADLLEDAHRDLVALMLAEARTSRLSETAPGFEVRDLSGRAFTLQGLKGKIVVLDFWNISCSPCLASFPFLQKVHEKQTAQGDVVILAVNTPLVAGPEAAVSAVKDVLKDTSYTFPIVIDAGMTERYGVQSFPTTIVLDMDGRIAYRKKGFEGSALFEDLSAKIETLRAGAKPR